MSRRWRDDDHPSRSPVARGLKQPTRKLFLRFRFRIEAGNLILPYLVLLFLVGLAQIHVTMETGGLLHRLFTLGQMTGLFSVALSVPFGPTRYVAPCPEELGLSSPILIGAIIYSALATLT